MAVNQARRLTGDERPPGPRPPLLPAAACEMAREAQATVAILVEGWSDQAAIESLARRRGWNLRSEGILTLPIGGVTNLGAFIQALGRSGLGLRLAGLCDAAEVDHARRSLERVGEGVALDRCTRSCTGSWAPAPDVRCATGRC